MKKLSNVQEAIEEAIRGGWHYFPLYFDILSLKESLTLEQEIAFGLPMLDPLFWAALGKARGWKAPLGLEGTEMWRHYARIWFENCMVGGDETKYWQSLP